ncbi:MAG: PfkB family carbohydrate kinase [Proteobacteria bacterium]|nr:PfkB family carbohydrate kinase [Pseudomonadota bacterium]
MRDKETLRIAMKSYDIVFVGHVVVCKFVHFERNPFIRVEGASTHGAAAASCCNKNIAVVTRMSEEYVHFIEPLRDMGIDVYVKHTPNTTRMKVVYPTENVDERQIYHARSAGFFQMDEMPSIKPCLVHLSGLSDQEFTLEFMKELKNKGFRLSIDIQAFLWKVDDATHVIHFKDLPDKKEILHMVEAVKLDISEAKAFTGTDDLEKAAAMIDNWGCSEIIITSSDGVFAYKEGKSYFERFSNRSVKGRTGRGDTTMGAYLARRIDHTVEDSLKFAAALVSIKMESEGPFMGTLEDVLARMEANRLFVNCKP